jgi:urease accessory protein
LNGHLDIVCSRLGSAGCHLRRQSFRAPLHLSKPHRDGDTLVVNLVNPTAGIFDDDVVHVRAVVEPGARLVLTTPSSSRVYRSRNGAAAVVRQSFEIAPGGYLEYFPEPFIPHAGARYRQENRITVEAGGALAFFEWLAPGRVARGEVFQFARLDWETDICAAGRLVARERYHLSPDDESLLGMRSVFEQAHYLGCFVVHGSAPPVEAVHQLESGTVFIGCGPLCDHGWCIKALCADSLTARRTLLALRSIVHQAMDTVPARLGRF